MVSDMLQPQDAELDVVRPPARLLVIEDDADQRETLRLRLTRLDYVVTATASGREGLRLARRERPAAILLDAGLPDADGFDVCQQLADDPATADIPVLIVSALDRDNVVREARRAGCRFFIRKPYDPNALLALLETAIREADAS